MERIGILCPCCTGASAASIDDGSFAAHLCRDCDHVWYDTSSIEISRDTYENSEKYETYYVGNPPFLWYHRKALKFLQRDVPGGRVLDFGCFDGFFTAKLVEAGFDAFGSDWNRKAIAHGREALGLGERLSRAPKGLYDAIVALEVIEHFTDPNDFIDAVRPYLKPGGALVLSCPNRRSVYRPKTDAPPHHFSRFSQKSVATLLTRRGFDVEVQEREMSSFQLLRNFIGDSLRRDAPLLNKSSEPKMTSENIHTLKLAANKMAGVMSLVLLPVDQIAHAIGLSYFSQFVVARLRHQEV